MDIVRRNQMLITFSFDSRFWGRSKQLIRVVKREFDPSKRKQTSALTQRLLERKRRYVCPGVLVQNTQYNNLHFPNDTCTCTWRYSAVLRLSVVWWEGEWEECNCGTTALYPWQQSQVHLSISKFKLLNAKFLALNTALRNFLLKWFWWE